MSEFEGLVAAVSGGASGIGLATARLLAQRGAAVAVLDLRTDNLPEPLTGFTCDVTSDDSARSAVDAVVAAFGRLDILINNAGVYTGAPVTELTEAQWDAAVDTNLKGPFLCAKHAARHMKSREGGGRIITVSSTSALVGIPNQASYQSSKHGVVGLTRTLAIELAPFAVTVNTVCPTVVYTPMLDYLMKMGAAYFQEVGRLCGASTVFPGLDALEVRDVSEAVLWLASPAARYVTGIALPVDGGFTCK